MTMVNLDRADRTTEAATCRAAVCSSERSVQQFSEHCPLLSKQAAVCGTEDPGAGRTVVTGTHREVRSKQRKTLGRTTGVAGARAGSQQCGSAGGERAPCGPTLDENKTPASGTAGTARTPSACGTDPEILKCTPEQCVCQGCGKETVVIGYAL